MRRRHSIDIPGIGKGAYAGAGSRARQLPPGSPKHPKRGKATLAGYSGSRVAAVLADDPTQVYDFNFESSTVAEVKAAFTFTRASLAWYWDKSTGFYTEASIDDPRLDKHPVVARTGILMEAADTNLMTDMDDCAVWINAGIQMEAPGLNNSTGIDGETSMTEAIPAAVSNHHTCRRTLTGQTASGFYVVSVFAKKSGYNRIRLAIESDAAPTTDFGYAEFDMNTGAILTAATVGGDYTLAGEGALIEDCGGGIYRCSVSMQIGAATGVRYNLYVVDDAGAIIFTGDAVKGVDIQFGQYEESKKLTSYVHSPGGATTTRAEEFCDDTGASWINASEGTIFVEATALGAGTDVDVSNRTIVTVSDNSSSDQLILWNTGAGGAIEYQVKSVSSLTVEIVSAVVAVNTPTKMAMAYKLNDSQMALAGTEYGPDTVCAMPVGLDTLEVGSLTNDNLWSGVVHRITGYDVRKTEAELEALTS